MPNIIKSETVDPRVLEVELTKDEMQEVFRYRNDGTLIGSEWRPKAEVWPKIG